ncbi:MAG: Fe-S oxidoreductase [Deltaproteobacteria bacterium RBG_13_61_14]|nr:MAG: Fe-S oxidoreductase [Deltaproteobacteria bacterium RBG_13_61_14]
MRVSLFIPCLVDTLLPEVGEATVRLLERLGLALDFPQDQTCCGQPAYNTGYWEDARRVARQFLRAFAQSEVIVAPSGSCVSMVRNHYPRLFRDHPSDLEAARRIAGRTFELTEFLVRRLGLTEVGAGFSGKITYHDSCHLNRELGVREEPRTLIKAAGAELSEMPEADRCCGFGGTFSIKFPEVSAAMAQRKAESIALSGAGTVVTCDPGCLLQIKGYFSRQQKEVRVLHIAEMLAAAK